MGSGRRPSGGLPQLDPIALRIGDPAESTHTFHVLRLFGDIRPLEAQLRLFRYLRGEPAHVTTIESNTLKLGLPA